MLHDLLQKSLYNKSILFSNILIFTHIHNLSWKSYRSPASIDISNKYLPNNVCLPETVYNKFPPYSNSVKDFWKTKYSDS